MRAKLGTRVGVLVALLPLVSQARPRPLFEPTDLEMENPGTLDLDLQIGPMRADSWRVVVPDTEIDLGLLPRVELDLDGAYAIESDDANGFSLDHPAPDNLWVAAKLGLWDWHQEGSTHAWALGLQLGPKVPLARDAHGAGYEGLVLLGYTWGESHLVLNLGGLVDPGAQVGAQRPIGAEGGFDVDLDLPVPKLSVTGELGAVVFFSDDPNQLHVTGGLKWSPSESLDLAVVGLVGLLSAGDRLGVLFGVSPKFAVWGGGPR